MKRAALLFTFLFTATRAKSSVSATSSPRVDVRWALYAASRGDDEGSLRVKEHRRPAPSVGVRTCIYTRARVCISCRPERRSPLCHPLRDIPAPFPSRSHAPARASRSPSRLHFLPPSLALPVSPREVLGRSRSAEEEQRRRPKENFLRRNDLLVARRRRAAHFPSSRRRCRAASRKHFPRLSRAINTPAPAVRS